MYYESEFATVEWNDEVKVAVLTWLKYGKGDDFRIPCKKALELAIKKKALKWYSDTSNAAVFNEDDRNWFNEEITPKMLDNGITSTALVIPKSIISKMSLDKAIEDGEKIGLKINYFSDPKEALEWLKTV